MPIKTILMLGNEKLNEVTQNIQKSEIEFIKTAVQDLHDTLLDFRQKTGFGRAIAAPQIGVMKQLIYMFIDKPIVFINPQIVFKSDEMIELWDDCMSFPDLLVKVKRHKSCKVKYRDLDWIEKEDYFDGDMSELFQHEYDHLYGILAVSRAIDGKSFALSQEINKIRVQSMIC